MIPYLVIFLIVGLSVFGVYLRLPSVKGRHGEAQVDRELARLDPSDYRIFRDLLVEAEDRTSQIDHVVLSRYGIFVVETKNYSGWIHGAENSRYWTQTIYRYKSRFLNPVKQNWAHVYALKAVLSDFGTLAFYPIVVFVGGAVLKNVHSDVRVIYLDDLVPAIRQTANVAMSDEQVSLIAQRLAMANIADRQARKQHVGETHKRKVVAESLERDLICPRCSGKMVLRAGRYGSFYGCNNYPKCRHTFPAS